MSSGCALLGTRAQSGRYVPINRSQTGVRTKRRFNVNLQEISLQSDALGKRVKLRLAVKTIRSVEHNGGLDKFLLTTKAAKLTLAGKRLKKEITKALSDSGKLPALKKAAPKAKKAPAKKAK